ncbi:hypothetical protein TGAM01_v200594 [Trichoderma gamsii]|uniref:Thiol-specific monooxygenase n=1 Tax=Trichoderma gamsii TaxID=398673 RepID=A0A2P5A0W1_9HYPO|nr:hypothetical protein TGAM01_v200594 [Trichoderma gamsii]PON30153.1 hypothetical protein TGAM01_v200594 [Trichoderma gamsii]
MGGIWSSPAVGTAASSSAVPAKHQQQQRQPFHVKKVAIIGAGPAGLAAARYLTAQGAVDSITIFEQQDEVGGVWHYSGLAPKEVPVPQQDPFWGPEPSIWPEGAPAPIFPSPMYERLHANIPGSLMQFHDTAFPADEWLFPKREAIQAYLVRYAEDLRHLIKFRHQVTQVNLESQDGRDQWHLEASSTVNDDQVIRETYDAVVVANGHYSVPFIPSIKNLQEFNKAHPSIISHSKQYRKNEHFRGKKVVVVGNGPSGLDLALQINEVADRTLMSVRHPTSPDKISHIGCEEVPEIVEFLPDQRGVLFKDGKLGDDGKHINEFYDWVNKAKHVGKQPPHWEGEQFWQRKLAPQAKTKFEEDGCRAKTLADLGYQYEPGKEQ